MFPSFDLTVFSFIAVETWKYLKGDSPKIDVEKLPSRKEIFDTRVLTIKEAAKHLDHLRDWSEFAKVQRDLNVTRIEVNPQRFEELTTDIWSVFASSVCVTEKISKHIKSYNEDYEFITSYIKENLEAIAMYTIHKSDQVLYLAWLATNPKNIVCDTNPQLSLRGAGSSIILKLIAICKNQNLHKISLIVDPSSVNFYNKIGFKHLIKSKYEIEVN